MNLIESIVSSGHGTLYPSYVVIHETANPGATAANHRDYWSRDDTYAVHYVADWTGEVYHTVPDDRLCWQVGNGNGEVVGIELCHATNQSDFEAMWRTGVEWARWMLDSRGWGTDRLISHNTARLWWGGTDHTDPLGYFEKFGRSWDDFVTDVERGSVAMGLRTGAAEAWPDYRSAWRLTKESDEYQGGLFSLRNCHTGQAITVRRPIGSGTGVDMADYIPGGDHSQMFGWSHSDAGDFGLSQAGHFLSAANGNFALMSTDGGVDVWAISDWRWNHNWALVPAMEGCYRIVNYDGSCLRV